MFASFRRRSPAIVLLAFTAIAASPLLSAPYLQSYDGLLHLFRLVALDAGLRQGTAFPRWLPDLAYGYGYPIYNYYPPLAEYVAETLHILGLSFPDAINGTCLAVIAPPYLAPTRWTLNCSPRKKRRAQPMLPRPT